MGSLDGKIALITGAASGTGRALALAYADEGAHVVIADVNLDGANAVADEIAAAGGSASAKSLNVMNTTEAKILVDEIVAEHQSLDILVNNAGIGMMKTVWETEPDDWDSIFDVNVRGLFFLTKAACEPMRRQKRGKIINMASIAGRRGEALASAHCASTAAVISITQSIALAMAPYGVDVNAMAPGIVESPSRKAEGESLTEAATGVPLGRTSVPGDIVPLAIFLAGSGSDDITAQTYNIDGGTVLN